jgi:hypothetical protein
MPRLLTALVVLLAVASVAGLFVVDDDEAAQPTATEFQLAGNEACDRLMTSVEAETDRRPLAKAVSNFRNDLEHVGAPEGNEATFDRLLAGLRAFERDAAKSGAAPNASSVELAVDAQQLGLTRCTLFSAARRGSLDRLAKSELRNALAAEKVYFVDNETFTESPAELTSIEPALTYAAGSQPAEERVIYLRVTGGKLYLSARSGGGRCFYLRDGTAPGEALAYASDVTCARAEDQQYGASW